MNKNVDSQVLLELNEKSVKKQVLSLKIFCVVFIAGYLFFFSSTSWFPGSDDLVAPSVIGKIYSWNAKQVQLEQWIYAPDEREMLIIAYINDTSYNSSKCKFELLDKKNGTIKSIEKICDADGLIVLHAKNLNSAWQEISLRISTDSSDDSILKLYANRKSIDQVTKLDLLSESEYLVQHLDFLISNYQKQIDDLQKEESANQDLIASTNKDIQDLEASKEYQTEEEQSQTNEKISQAKQQITAYKNKNASLESQITEYQERIDILNKKKQTQEE